MPSATNIEAEVTQVSRASTLLNDALAQARHVKPASTIEPALTESDFSRLLEGLPQVFADPDSISDAPDKPRQFAVVETAARDLFSNLVVSTGSCTVYAGLAFVIEQKF